MIIDSIIRMKKNCENCIYYKEIRPKTKYFVSTGICRRYPQTVDTNSTKWCGEYKEVEIIDFEDLFYKDD